MQFVIPNHFDLKLLLCGGANSRLLENGSWTHLPCDHHYQVSLNCISPGLTNSDGLSLDLNIMTRSIAIISYGAAQFLQLICSEVQIKVKKYSTCTLLKVKTRWAIYVFAILSTWFHHWKSSDWLSSPSTTQLTGLQLGHLPNEAKQHQSLPVTFILYLFSRGNTFLFKKEILQTLALEILDQISSISWFKAKMS